MLVIPLIIKNYKQIAKDLEDNILTDGAIKKLTLNKLFEKYRYTRVNYLKTWENRVKEER